MVFAITEKLFKLKSSGYKYLKCFGFVFNLERCNVFSFVCQEVLCNEIPVAGQHGTKHGSAEKFIVLMTLIFCLINK